MKSEAFAEVYEPDSRAKEIIEVDLAAYEAFDDAEAEALSLVREYNKAPDERREEIKGRLAEILSGRFEQGRRLEREIIENGGAAPRYADAMVQGMLERLMIGGTPPYIFTEVLDSLNRKPGFESFHKEIKGCMTGARSVCDYVEHQKRTNPDRILGTHLLPDVYHKIDAFAIDEDERGGKIVTFIQIKSGEQDEDDLYLVQKAHQGYLDMRLEAEKVMNSEAAEKIPKTPELLEQMHVLTVELLPYAGDQRAFDEKQRAFSKKHGLSPALLPSLCRDQNFDPDIFGLDKTRSDHARVIASLRGYNERPYETQAFHRTFVPDSILNGVRYYSQTVIGSRKAYDPKELKINWN